MKTRNHKQKGSYEDERKKIRQSILKVFRSRMKSPARQGAISTEKSLLSRDQVYELVSSPNSSMSDNDSAINKYRLKPKRKRKRSERNKSRSKTTVSRMTGDKEMAGNRPVKRYSSITQNRLTTRLGLFNKGKQSGTIARGPIKVSDSIREKTEEDLKKILNISDTDSHDIPCVDATSEKENYFTSGDLPIYHAASTSSHGGHNKLPGSNAVTPLSDIQPRSHGSASVSSRTCSPVPKAITKETLPESPPLESMVNTLMSELKPCKIFPGHYYLQELQDELNKLVKQNHTSAEDCTAATPGPVRHTPGSVNSETVKRSLLRSILDSTDTTDTEMVAAKSKTPVAMETDAYQQNIVPDPTLQHVQYIHTAQTEISNLTDLTDVDLFDAKTLLSKNDAMIASKSQQHHTVESVRYPAPGDRDRSEISGDLCRSSIDGYINDRHSQSSQSSGYYSHYNTAGDPRLCTQTNSATYCSNSQLAVVAKFHEHPEYMPQFHGDYYKDKISAAEHTWPGTHSQYDSPSEVNPMDLLEMVDEGEITTHAPLEPSHPGLISATPDSDGSPLFLPQNLLPLKPSLGSPSPPQKLYPRRLY